MLCRLASHGALAVSAMLSMNAAAVSQVVPGSIDTFQDGTVDNWVQGASSPNPTVNVPSGGPAGANDAYLKITANGGAGAGGKMIAFNQVQWTGVYNGVTSIGMDLNSLGSAAMSIRLTFEDNGGNMWSSTTPFAVPAAAGWMHAVFQLDDASMTQVGGLPKAFSAGLASGIIQVRILHAAAPAFNGDTIAATLGVDNILAQGVPEPGTLALAGAAAMVLFLRRRSTKPAAVRLVNVSVPGSGTALGV
jgi:hypothetical protein